MSLCFCLGSESFLLLPQRQAGFASILLPEAMDFCLVLGARGFSALPQLLKIFAFQKEALGKKARLACLPAAAACLCHLLHVCAVDGASLQSVTLPLTFFCEHPVDVCRKELESGCKLSVSEALSYSTLTH